MNRIAWTCAGGFAALSAILWFSRPPAQPLVATLARLTLDMGVNTWPAISSDGRLVVYASDRDGGKNLDLYLQPVMGGAPQRLTDTDGNESEPEFSPDAGTIAFHSEKDGGGIYVMPSRGGDARRLVKGGHNPRFSPDGKWIGYTQDDHAFLISTSGGQPRAIQPGLAPARSIAWSPHGDLLLVSGPEKTWVAPAFSESPATAISLSHVDDFNWTAEGLIYTARSGWARNVYLTPMDAKGRITGSAMPLTNGTEVADHVAVSRSSRLAFSSGSQKFNSWALPIDADKGKVTGVLTRLTDGFGIQSLPAHASPDGRVSYSMVCRESSCAIQAAGPDGSSIVLYDSDTPSLSLAGVNPAMRGFAVERDRIVMILAEQQCNIWLADLHH